MLNFRRNLFIPTLAVITLCVPGISGCDSKPQLVAVKGSVRVDDKPASGALVLFFPSDPSAPISSASCNEAGEYTVTTDSQAGIKPGSYTVTVRWPDPAKQPTEAQKMTGNYSDPPDLLKGKYINKTDSPLKAEVAQDTTEIAAFNLSTK